MCSYAIKSQHNDTIATICNSDNGNDNRNSTQSEKPQGLQPNILRKWLHAFTAMIIVKYISTLVKTCDT